MAIKSNNEYRLENGYAVLICKNRKGEIFESKIDLEDLERVLNFSYKWFYLYVYNGYIRSTVYLGIINGKPKNTVMLLHHFITGASKEIIIDHINRDTLDNRKGNLRIVNSSENLMNRKRRNSNNTTGYRNVAKVKNEFIVQLQVNGKNTRLGRFKTAKEAGEFAKEMRKKYYGEFEGSDD